jgi:hypothetical protein
VSRAPRDGWCAGCQVHGCFRQASTQRTSPAKQPVAHSAESPADSPIA